MATFQEMFGNFAFVALMVLSIFGMIVTIQGSNDAPQPLIEHSLFNNSYLKLYGNISDMEATSNNQYNLFDSETPTPGFGAIVMFTIVNVGKTFAGTIFTLFALVIKLPLIVLGIDQTITSMLTSFLVISLVIALWVVYKFGG